jgi:hypothetical protein
MTDLFRYLLGLGVVVGFVVFYAWIKTFAEFKEAKEKLIRTDIAEFGQCCGLENGVCTLPARLDKLNKIDAAKKDK